MRGEQNISEKEYNEKQVEEVEEQGIAILNIINQLCIENGLISEEEYTRIDSILK